jgi:hypothetical protein
MKKFLLPPFLPILAVLLYLVGLAIVEAQMGPGVASTNADGETHRWVIFVPIFVAILFPILLVANISDLVLQEILPSQWQVLSIPIAGSALGVALCLWAIKGNGPVPYVICAASCLAAVAAMNWWRNHIVRNTTKNQPNKSQ